MLQKLLFIFLKLGDSFGRALLYEYELPPSFRPQTLTIVFYERDTLGMMKMITMLFISNLLFNVDVRHLLFV